MTPIRRNRTASVFALGLLVSLLSSSRAFTQATDAIGPVTFVGPGGDLNAFPITAAITAVHLRLEGLEVEFTKRDGPNRWPDTCTGVDCKETRLDGTVIDMGHLQYSLGVALNINGQWYGSAPIETWYGNNVTGGQIQATGQLPDNWFYDPNRWAPLTGYQPQPGETIGVFVVAGDARNDFFVGVNYNVQERSNIVALPLPAPNVAASFCFNTAGQIIACPPPPAATAPALGAGGGTAATGGTTFGTAGTGGVGVDPLTGLPVYDPFNNLSTLSSVPGTGTTTPTSPPPQYATSGANQRAGYVSGGADSDSSSGGGGGGGCFAGAGRVSKKR